jgi:RimJ/RimL family protein N-acetyltransferase
MTNGPAILRVWSPADGAWYAGQLADADIQRFTSEQLTTTAEDFRAALARLNAREDQVGFAIVEAATGRLAGNIAADLTADGAAEVSYWVAPGLRGQGIASHALRQLCVWITDHWQAQEIVLCTHAENVASQRVAERAGFQYEPERDEPRTVGGQVWPARWFIRPS